MINCFIAVSGVAVGSYLASPNWLTIHTGLTGLAVFFVCAGGNALNDARDVAIDRISHPDRVLVRGELSKRTAIVMTAVFMASGLMLASLVNVTVVAIGAAGILLTLSYDLWLKQVPLLGNVLVAVSAGLTFLIGGAASDPERWCGLPGPMIPFIFAILFHLVRELVKDVEDREGDMQSGIVTLPSRMGVKPTLTLASALTAISIILTAIPYALHWFGLLYLVFGVGLAQLPTLFLLLSALKSPSASRLRQTSTMLKVGMILGLLALIMG